MVDWEVKHLPIYLPAPLAWQCHLRTRRHLKVLLTPPAALSVPNMERAVGGWNFPGRREEKGRGGHSLSGRAAVQIVPTGKDSALTRVL